MEMERVSTNLLYGGRRYWRTKGYMRLNSHSRRKRKMRMRVLKLGSGAADGSTSCWRFWRIKLRPPVLKLRFSPMKFMLRMRDAYVDMMLRIVSTRMIRSGFERLPIKEYDEGMIAEMYRDPLWRRKGSWCLPDAAWIAEGNLDRICDYFQYKKEMIHYGYCTYTR